jgi:hypothetical protein
LAEAEMEKDALRHSALGYRTPAEYAATCRHTHTPVACEIN